MDLLRLFGIGSEKILAQGCHVSGSVTKAYHCWWMTVNTKPVRRFSGDGARYPHVITFTYTVEGIPYEGKLWIPYNHRAPSVGTEIAVYYDPEKPQNYACHSFGPAL